MSDVTVADPYAVATGDEEQLVTMMVDGQLFGIPILGVQDIVEPEHITPVPKSPSAIAGVLNLRGRIVTVIDLRKCLGNIQGEGPEHQMGVTVEHRNDLYTLLVDAIGDVRHLPKKDFDKPPATLDENIRRVCLGIFRLENDLLVVLDVERILDEETIRRTPIVTRSRRILNQNNGEHRLLAKMAEAKADEASEPEAEAEAEDAESEAPGPTDVVEDASSENGDVEPAEFELSAPEEEIVEAPEPAAMAANDAAPAAEAPQDDAAPAERPREKSMSLEEGGVVL